MDTLDPDERLPYWCELWPSSLALAEWLALRRHEFTGKACLDAGCGLGFTALAGQWLGGKVIGMDYSAEALGYARANAVLNQISQPLWLVMDWRAPAIKAGAIHRLWAADVMYEARFAAPLAAFVAHCLAPEGCAWLADPGRSTFPLLQAQLHAHGLNLAPVHHASPVTVWAASRANALH